MPAYYVSQTAKLGCRRYHAVVPRSIGGPIGHNVINPDVNRLHIEATIQIVSAHFSVVQQNYGIDALWSATKIFYGRTALRATAESLAMGDLSRGQNERDSMLKDFLRDRDRGESRRKRRTQIAAKRAFRLTARTLVAAIKELQNKFLGPNERCAWQLEPFHEMVSVPIGKPFAMRGLDRHFFGGAVRCDLSPECAAKRTSADHSEFMGGHALIIRYSTVIHISQMMRIGTLTALSGNSAAYTSDSCDIFATTS
jgi:hypothetical protein